MKKITFSIIVVCLNAGQELLRTVDSILGQTYPHFEIIVKDGMSSDGFVEKLPGDERIRVVRQKDKGIYDAMNQAIPLVSGDYVLFLNCGDYFYNEKVLEKTGAWISHPGKSIMGISIIAVWKRGLFPIPVSMPLPAIGMFPAIRPAFMGRS